MSKNLKHDRSDRSNGSNFSTSFEEPTVVNSTPRKRDRYCKDNSTDSYNSSFESPKVKKQDKKKVPEVMETNRSAFRVDLIPKKSPIGVQLLDESRFDTIFEYLSNSKYEATVDREAINNKLNIREILMEDSMKVVEYTKDWLFKLK